MEVLFIFYSAHHCITAGYIGRNFRWNTDIKPRNFGTCKVRKGIHTQCSSSNIESDTSNRLSCQGSTLLSLAQPLTLVSPPALLKDGLSSLCKHLELSVLNTLKPVSEASTNTGEKRIDPEGFLGEDGTHFDSELPKADGNACVNVTQLAQWLFQEVPV